MTTIHVGTSGWGYKDWKEDFYPSFFQSRDYLAYYSQFFKSVEINSSFYHLPLLKTVENWTNMVPDDFKFCPKMSRYVTHYNKLINVEEPLQRFFEVFKYMHNKLGPILLQLPSSVAFDLLIIEDFFKLLLNKYNSYQFACEARHISWYTPEAIGLLKKYNIILVTSHSDGRFPYSEEVTSKEVYYRFHGPETLYSSNYDEEILKKYANQFLKLINGGHNVWVFFNNTMYIYGLENAMTIQELAEGKNQ